jgi:hypothetical protein
MYYSQIAPKFNDKNALTMMIDMKDNIKKNANQKQNEP